MTPPIPHRPIHVLFFIGSMGGGGAERQVVEIMKRLDRSKFRVSLYLHHRQGELLGEVPEDVTIHSFWDQFGGTWRSKMHHLFGTTDRARYGDLARVMRREKIDLLFSETYLAALDAAQAGRLVPQVARLAVCVGDPVEEVRLYAQERELEQSIELARQAFESAHRVLAVSRGIRQRLIDDLKLDPGSVEVFYNMIDVDDALRLATVEANPSESEGFHLLTVGRLSEEKGHRFLLEAVDRLVKAADWRDLVWHILGTGPLESSLREEVERRGLQDHVRFEGFQKNPFPYYRAADLLCLPSLHEAFGCVLIEALACRLPVLATDCPSGPREILCGEKYGCLVSPGSADALVRGIQNCRSNLKGWQQASAAGQSYVRETFSFQAGIPRLEEIMSQTFENVNLGK